MLHCVSLYLCHFTLPVPLHFTCTSLFFPPSFLRASLFVFFFFIALVQYLPAQLRMAEGKRHSIAYQSSFDAPLNDVKVTQQAIAQNEICSMCVTKQIRFHLLLAPFYIYQRPAPHQILSCHLLYSPSLITACIEFYTNDLDFFPFPPLLSMV